ncbi:MAG: glycosyltransferase family 8 protein [Alphaproteobacteria bacterium]|nr:glycosyltransferase family 8 protein [Alphaproteobacteria bacterium]
MKKIPVCFCTDDNYALPTCVAITSLIQNKLPETTYDIYIIIDNVSPEKQEKLQACTTPKNPITLINVPKQGFKKNKNNCDYVSVAAFLRFELANLLPQYNKILYLDGDILVLKDLSDLYDTLLGDTYVGCVRDFAGEKQLMNKKIGLKHYFNSGVLLINAKKWREENIRGELYNIWEKHNYFTYMDQDVMNFAFLENVTWINPKYNLMASNLIESNIDINTINQEAKIPYSDFKSLEKESVILHLTSSKKPWNSPQAYGQHLWLKYFKKSPMKNYPLNIPQKNKIMDFFYHKKMRKNKKITYFFGIPTIKEKYYQTYKKKYILGVKIRKKKFEIISEISSPNFQADLKTLHANTFGKYKESLRGKDVVLVATGPSLKDFIPLKDVVYVGVNKAFTCDKIKLDYSFVQDYTIGEITLGRLEEYAKKNKTQLFYGDIVGVAHIPVECAERAGAKRYYTDSFREPNFKLTHQIDREPLGDFNSIVFSAMQFILWCHPKRVYIVGCDCSLGGYFNSKEQNTFCVPATEMVNRWKNLRDFANKYYPDVEIVSVNPVGLKGVFKDLYQEKEE